MEIKFNIKRNLEPSSHQLSSEAENDFNYESISMHNKKCSIMKVIVPHVICQIY